VFVQIVRLPRRRSTPSLTIKLGAAAEQSAAYFQFPFGLEVPLPRGSLARAQSPPRRNPRTAPGTSAPITCLRRPRRWRGCRRRRGGRSWPTDGAKSRKTRRLRTTASRPRSSTVASSRPRRSGTCGSNPCFPSPHPLRHSAAVTKMV
jgi:hypothetical protein